MTVNSRNEKNLERCLMCKGHYGWERKRRQWGSRYTAHAGRNLPVKEFCYLRTLFTDSRRVIGTADTLSVEERVLRERETVTTMCPRVPSSRTLRSWMIVLEHPWTSRNVFPLSMAWKRTPHQSFHDWNCITFNFKLKVVPVMRLMVYERKSKG